MSIISSNTASVEIRVTTHELAAADAESESNTPARTPGFNNNNLNPPKPGDDVVLHPWVGAGIATAIASIINLFNSVNGLSMVFTDVLTARTEVVTDIQLAQNQQLNADYTDLNTYVSGGHSGDKDYSGQVSDKQTKFQTDTTIYGSLAQQPQSEVDKLSQQVKDFGTDTQGFLQTASSILSAAQNTSQQLAH